jgi:hypothetical protein
VFGNKTAYTNIHDFGFSGRFSQPEVCVSSLILNQDRSLLYELYSIALDYLLTHTIEPDF